MTSTLLFIGREAADTREVLETHARRARRRGAVDEARVALGTAAIRAAAADLEGETVYAVPASFGGRAGDDERVAEVAARVDRTRRCEPVGWSPAATAVLAERAAAAADGRPEETAVVLVGPGGGAGRPRRVGAYHAARLARDYPVAEVHDCYLYRDPAAECARYEVSADPVAVPLYLAPCRATREVVPDRLDAPCAAPVGTHDRVTDAVVAEVERRRAVAEGGSPAAWDGERAVAADGGRRPRGED